MINPTSSSDRSSPANGAEAASAHAHRRSAPRPDKLALDSMLQLQKALHSQPEIRPEVVERGIQLAADDSYPSKNVLRQIGGMLMASPDLSEDNL